MTSDERVTSDKSVSVLLRRSPTHHSSLPSCHLSLQVAAIDRRQLFKPAARFTGERAFCVAPAPVALFAGRDVHASFRAQSQYVLQWDDGDVCDGGHRRADKVPVNLATIR